MSHLLPDDRKQFQIDIQVDIGPFLRQEGRYPPKDVEIRNARSIRINTFSQRRRQPRPLLIVSTPTVWVSWLRRKILSSD